MNTLMNTLNKNLYTGSSAFNKGFVKAAIELKPEQFDQLINQARAGNEAAAKLVEELGVANSQIHATNQVLNQGTDKITGAITGAADRFEDLGSAMGRGIGSQLVQRFNTGVNAAGGGLLGAGLGGGLGYWLGKGQDKNKDRSRAGAIIGGLSGAGLGTLLGAKIAAEVPKLRFNDTNPLIKGLNATQMATALQGAETPKDVFPDPWIRTTHAPKEGSTAFGPLQITGRLARDFMNNPLKREWINPTNRPFLTNFVHQAGEFAKFGRNPGAPGYNKIYDYGGSGHLTTPADKANYLSMGNDMIRYQMNDALTRGGDPVTEFLRNWHSRAEPVPTGYSNRFSKIFNQLVNTNNAVVPTNNVVVPTK